MVSAASMSGSHTPWDTLLALSTLASSVWATGGHKGREPMHTCTRVRVCEGGGGGGVGTVTISVEERVHLQAWGEAEGKWERGRAADTAGGKRRGL
jgi:hypothetical protein